MRTFEVSVAAPPRVVFDYLADPRRRPEWQVSLRSVDVLDVGPPRLHTRWVDRTAVGARPRLQIVDLRPPGIDGEPGTWAEAGRWHGLRAEVSLRFDQEPGGTRVSGTVAISSEPWLLPLRLVLQALAPIGVSADLRRARRILEGR